MNRYESNINGVVGEPIPLFASSILALFYVLRQNFSQRRLLNRPDSIYTTRIGGK